MGCASLNDRLERIKSQKEEIDFFVEEYKPFIASCVQKATGRYVRYGEDDELSIGLMAFVEAVKSHNTEKGNFLSFAQNVIKRRLIDYYRKEKKHGREVSLNEYYNEDENEVDLSVQESLKLYSVGEISEFRKLELDELKKELKNWDIDFFQLAESSPKHDSTKKLYSSMMKFLMSRADLIEQIRKKKYLPVAEMEKCTGIPRKKIDRARKYIIAVVIINTGDYQYIRDYLEFD